MLTVKGGQLYWNKDGDTVKVFEISDESVSGKVSYYGYVNNQGEYIIQKVDRNSDPTSYRYAYGKSGYISDFNNRAALTYEYWYNIK